MNAGRGWSIVIPATTRSGQRAKDKPPPIPTTESTAPYPLSRSPGKLPPEFELVRRQFTSS